MSTKFVSPYFVCLCTDSAWEGLLSQMMCPAAFVTVAVVLATAQHGTPPLHLWYIGLAESPNIRCRMRRYCCTSCCAHNYLVTCCLAMFPDSRGNQHSITFPLRACCPPSPTILDASVEMKRWWTITIYISRVKVHGVFGCPMEVTI